MTHLLESTYPADLQELSEDGIIRGAVVLRGGFNKAGTRYYPKDTLERSAHLLIGVKQYADHAYSPASQRSVRDWWSTIIEAWYDPEMNALRANIVPHAPELKNILAVDVARKNVGLSIDASGVQERSEVDGRSTSVVKDISVFHSVDWVPEAGAGGGILESDVPEIAQKEAKNVETTWDFSEEDLRTHRPELVASILEATIEEYEEKVWVYQKALGETILEASGLSDLSKDYVRRGLERTRFSSPEELKAWCEAEIAEQRDMLEKIKESAKVEVPPGIREDAEATRFSFREAVDAYAQRLTGRR